MKNPKISAGLKRYYRKKRQREYHRARKDSVQRMAREVVNEALKRGIIKRPEKCEGWNGEACEATEKLQAHHQSYDPDAWLTINWLCPRHHRRADDQRREDEQQRRQ